MNLSVKRMLAFIVDIIILYILISFLVAIFVKTEEIMLITEKTFKLLSDYMKNVNIETLNQLEELVYKSTKASIASNYIGIGLYLIYFAVLPLLTEGQTIGKKLLKIKLKPADDKNLSFGGLFVRSLVLYGVFINIVNVLVLEFGSKSTYLKVSSSLQFLQYLIFFICFVGIVIKSGRGLHDKLAKTQVVLEEGDIQEKMDEWKSVTADEKRAAESMKRKHTTQKKGK